MEQDRVDTTNREIKELMAKSAKLRTQHQSTKDQLAKLKEDSDALLDGQEDSSQELDETTRFGTDLPGNI